MKKKTVKQQLEEYKADIVLEIECWKHTNEHGCGDPFWADGGNMNLTRNHIIYDKRMIVQICEKNNLYLPEEYYLPTPPEVDEYYMATLNEKERVERMRLEGETLTTRRVEYDSQQLTLFD